MTVTRAHVSVFYTLMIASLTNVSGKYIYKYINAVLNLLTHEVIVPGTLARHHEEAQEPIRQQHLHSLVMGWQVAFRVVALVCVLPPPLVAAGRQFVSGERAGSWREADEHR